jgi:YesN/AraC family two-component response regulator
MYKILIADDEAVVREGIRDMMSWHELGYELVGAFENGREVIRALDDLHPDVVLTDINMPFVDGLELSRYLFEHFPRTKVIILTGYDEFDYAQQALGIGYWSVKAAVMAVKGEKVEKNIDTGFHWYDKTNLDSDQIKPLLYN